MTQTVKTWAVIIDGQRILDLDPIFHFWHERNAIYFAKGKTHYGQAAGAEQQTVPARIARRWMFQDDRHEA